MDPFAKRALEEYNGEIAQHHGGIGGRPYWNAHSTQFTYNPKFLFPIIPEAKGYLFTATDKDGKEHSFVAEKSTSLLTPIWKDIPTGMVTLKVESLDKDGKPKYLAGARTFFKCDPFPGRENLPPRACSYEECAVKAYRYVFNHKMIEYLYKTGEPDPEYEYNTYPSKMMSAIINAMIFYSKLEPEHAEKALDVAKKAADYLISISYGKGSPVEGLPPTFDTSYRKGYDKSEKNAADADDRKGRIMLVYPANVASAYLALEEATGEKRFFDAAMKIASYYRDNVLSCGSWNLFVSAETGKSEVINILNPQGLMTFMASLYKRTGDKVWSDLADGCFSYLQKNCIDGYNFESQFEDSPFSEYYSDLTHFAANAIIKYIADNKSDDPKAVETAVTLMRFVEDQFVVWGEYAKWLRSSFGYNEHFKSPAGLEQYAWYVPVDGSTATIMTSFYAVYKLTGDELWREKAYALADMITRMQNPETGMLPTQWITKDANKDVYSFWVNCHLGTAGNMYRISKGLFN